MINVEHASYYSLVKFDLEMIPWQIGRLNFEELVAVSTSADEVLIRSHNLNGKRHKLRLKVMETNLLVSKDFVKP